MERGHEYLNNENHICLFSLVSSCSLVLSPSKLLRDCYKCKKNRNEFLKNKKINIFEFKNCVL